MTFLLRLLASSLCAAMLLPSSALAAAHAHRGPAPTEAAAAPAAAPAPVTEPPADAAADLTAQREAAASRRTADPSPANYHAEGELAERAGDWAGAIAAYEQEVARMAPDDPGRAAAQQNLARARDGSRGVVSDEGASTHRKELDRKWTEPQATPKNPKAKPQPLAKAQGDDRIVKKWYFWVTIGAIVASAAAVTGIAIKASQDDKPDSLDRRAVFGIGTGALRF